MEVVGKPKVKRSTTTGSRSSSRPTTVDPMAHIETIYDKVVDDVTGEYVVKRSFAVGKFLGKGGFARCYELICDATGKKYAGKVVAKTSLIKPKSKQKFQAEIRIHRSLHHARVVRFYSCFEDDENWYILLELCRNHTLSDLLRKRKHLSEYEVRYYIAQILQGVDYLHVNNVIHRDLKLGNIFLASQMQVKLGDFGLAAQLEHKDERKLTVCGTPNYIAPEIISSSSSRKTLSSSPNPHNNNDQNAKKGHSFEVDIWSIGVIAYTLLFGKPPFETQDIKSTYRRIKACVYSFPTHIEVSESAKDLIRRILQFEPDMRLPLASIRSHAFFTAAAHVPDSLPTSSYTMMPPTTTMTLMDNPGASNDKAMMMVQRTTTTARLPLQARDMNVIQSSSSSDKTTTTTGPPSKSSRRLRPSSTSPGKLSLEKTHATLERCLKSAPAAPTREKENNDGTALERDIAAISLHEPSSSSSLTSETQLTWIRHWVDYTSRYGMGYVLCNGHAGVYFNDSTKIILNPDTRVFHYIERTRFVRLMMMLDLN